MRCGSSPQEDCTRPREEHPFWTLLRVLQASSVRLGRSDSALRARCVRRQLSVSHAAQQKGFEGDYLLSRWNAYHLAGRTSAMITVAADQPLRLLRVLPSAMPDHVWLGTAQLPEPSLCQQTGSSKTAVRPDLSLGLMLSSFDGSPTNESSEPSTSTETISLCFDRDEEPCSSPLEARTDRHDTHVLCSPLRRHRSLTLLRPEDLSDLEDVRWGARCTRCCA